MLFVALETSSLRGSLALFRGGDLLRQVVFPEGLVHGREIALELRDLLEIEGVRAADLDALAVGVGPGSYTGTRVGVTAAKTLGFALRIPALPCSSLEALALPLLEGSGGEARSGGGAGEAGSLHAGEASCLPVLDARRELYYFALFARAPGGEGIRRVSADRVGPAAAIGEAIGEVVLGETAGEAPILVAGDGADRLLERLDRAPGRALLRAPRDLDFPEARSLGRLAAPLLEGMEFDPEVVHRLEPAYLRPSEPEILAERRASRGAAGR